MPSPQACTCKGYGFIAAGGGVDVFVHFSVITGGGCRSFEEGQKVQFDIRQGQRERRHCGWPGRLAAYRPSAVGTNAATALARFVR